MNNKEGQVYLLKIIRVNHNVYFPGYYARGYLPSEYLNNPEYVYDPSKNPNNPNPHNINEENIVKIKSEMKEISAPIKTPDPYKTEHLMGNSAININTATVQEISTQFKIGLNIAAKIASARAEKLFDSIEDLNNRVPLSTGSWEDFKEQIIFDVS